MTLIEELEKEYESRIVLTLKEQITRGLAEQGENWDDIEAIKFSRLEGEIADLDMDVPIDYLDKEYCLNLDAGKYNLNSPVGFQVWTKNTVYVLREWEDDQYIDYMRRNPE